MPAAVRLQDPCTGHGCFGGRPNVQGSPDTFINGKPAHRQGDGWAVRLDGVDEVLFVSRRQLAAVRGLVKKV